MVLRRGERELDLFSWAVCHAVCARPESRISDNLLIRITWVKNNKQTKNTRLYFLFVYSLFCVAGKYFCKELSGHKGLF